VKEKLIQCTKKLLDQLNGKPQPVPDELPLFSCHANLITFNHRKTVVLMNDETISQMPLRLGGVVKFGLVPKLVI
jgi:hypothetical protein